MISLHKILYFITETQRRRIQHTKQSPQSITSYSATIITTPRITRGISTTRLVDRDLCVVRESVICLAVSERKDGKKQENEKVQGDGKKEPDQSEREIQRIGKVEERRKTNEGHEGVERNEIPDQAAYHGINPVQPGHY